MSNQSSTPKLVTKKHIARQQREKQQVRIILAVTVAAIVVVLLLVGYGILKTTYFDLQQSVAEVNGDKITLGQWQERVRLERVRQLNMFQMYSFYQQSFGMDMSQQLEQIQFTLSTPSILGQQVLDTMVDELVIRQEAEKLGISVSEEELNKSIQEAYGFFPNGTYTPTVTSTPFVTATLSAGQLTLYPSTATPTTAPTSTAAPTNTPDSAATATATATASVPTPTFVPEAATATATPYTIEGFNSQYDETVTDLKVYDISETTLRSVYEMQLLRQKVLDQVVTDVTRTEEQVWARHILVETEAEAEAVRRDLLERGIDFAEEAKKFSKDTGSGVDGGDLGWFGKGAMVAPFEEAAFSQKVGEIGEAVKSDFGYHIIQVLGREERPLSDSQYQQNRETAFTEWIATARETAAITTYDTVWQGKVPTEPMALNTPVPSE